MKKIYIIKISKKMTLYYHFFQFNFQIFENFIFTKLLLGENLCYYYILIFHHKRTKLLLLTLLRLFLFFFLLLYPLFSFSYTNLSYILGFSLPCLYLLYTFLFFNAFCVIFINSILLCAFQPSFYLIFFYFYHF